jgi:hypothetical protein
VPNGHGAGDWGLGRVSVPPIAALTVLVVTLFGVTLPSPAAAQQVIGFHGGGTVDPEGVFAGVFWQSGDVGGGFRLRPGIDGGTGQGVRIAAINFDFIYGIPLGGSGWTFVTGGGPSVVITRIPEIDLQDTGVGGHYLFGFGHDSGFFTEVRLGSGNVQQLTVGVGWAITLN